MDANNGQLNMFDSGTPAAVLPLPEHLNYGVHDRGDAQNSRDMRPVLLLWIPG